MPIIVTQDDGNEYDYLYSLLQFDLNWKMPRWAASDSWMLPVREMSSEDTKMFWIGLVHGSYSMSPSSTGSRGASNSSLKSKISMTWVTYRLCWYL